MKGKNKMEIAKEIILKEFYFLERQGFIPVIKINNDTSTFIDSLDVEYENLKKKRKVSIGYTQAKVYEDTNYTFHASLVRLPYCDATEDFFSLNIYLKSIGENFSTTLINRFDEMEAKSIIKKIAGALEKFASKIINGSEWQEGYYARWN